MLGARASTRVVGCEESCGLVERSYVDPVNRSLALTLFPGAAGGCKMGAVNC